MFRSASVFAALALAAASSFAAPITPTGSSFGTLPDATFGGSGIDNTAVEINNATRSIGTIGLTATPRFDAPALTNDGAGTFYAQAGSSTNPAYALWNFGFYIAPVAASRVPVTYTLFYDFDPAAAATDQSAHGQVSFGSPAGVTQDSWNLGMGFLGNAQEIVGVTSPTYGAFDPNVAGVYTFALVANGLAGELGRAAIEVNVAAVPEPESYALMFAGLGVIGFIARRRKTA